MHAVDKINRYNDVVVCLGNQGVPSEWIHVCGTIVYRIVTAEEQGYLRAPRVGVVVVIVVTIGSRTD
jgi:hypothetical protein